MFFLNVFPFISNTAIEAVMPLQFLFVKSIGFEMTIYLVTVHFFSFIAFYRKFYAYFSKNLILTKIPTIYSKYLILVILILQVSWPHSCTICPIFSWYLSLECHLHRPLQRCYKTRAGSGCYMSEGL